MAPGADLTLDPKGPLAEENQRLRSELDRVRASLGDVKRRLAEQQESLAVTCRREDETVEALRMAQMIIDRSPVILFRRLAGEDPRLVYVSENIRRFGYSASAFLAGEIHFKDIVHPDDQVRVHEEIVGSTQKNHESYTLTYRVLTADGQVRWVEDQTTVIHDAEGNKAFHQGIVVDITERKLAEDRLARSEEKFRRIVETTGEGFVMMDENMHIVAVNDAYCRMLGYAREDLLGKTPLDLATDDFRQFMLAGSERILAMEYRKLEGKVKARDGRVVPVLIHGNTLRDDKGRKLGNVAFVSDLTEQKKALTLAGQIQRSLLPSRAPDIPGYDIAGRSDACEEVGGDYLDYLYGAEFASDHLRIIVGDISGHGVDAALLMTSARTFTRMRALQPGGPAQLVSAMNRHMSGDMAETGHFMTLFFMEIDTETGSIHWVRAGHDPALVYRPEQDRFEELMGGGLPLGVDEAFAYRQHTLSGLSHGTVIALVTDGAWESVNENGEVFGKQRLRDLLRRHAGKSAQEIVNCVHDDISGFARGLPRQDDITLVVVKVVRAVSR